MFYGIVGVTGIAFACSTEFIPELNEQMKLVPFTSEFKTVMTTVMIVDYVACYVIEIVLKYLFSDLAARDIAERRPDQLVREKARKEAAAVAKIEAENRAAAEKVAEFERRQAEQIAALERKQAERQERLRQLQQQHQ